MKPDFRGRVALVTEGTGGIGLASAIAFARNGAQTVLTCSTGGMDEDCVRRLFADLNAAEPLIVYADVSDPIETAVLMEQIARRHTGVHLFVGNAPQGIPVTGVGDLTEQNLLQSIQYGTWPMIDYLAQIRRCFGAYPRHAIMISSTRPDRYSVNGDLVATAGAALEALCRFVAYRLRDQDIRLNVVRTPAALPDFFAEPGGPCAESHVVSAHDVANSVVALCSGLLDGMHGQVITVDGGAAFADTAAREYVESSHGQ